MRKKCKNCEGRGKKCVVGCAMRREDGEMPGFFDECTCGPPICPECQGTGERNRHDVQPNDSN
jgi:hypothetical protein